MVKYGYCKISCKKCDTGIAIKTNIQRDKEWEDAVINIKCQHFEFWCDLFTYDSFNPYKDEIQFKTHAKCLECGEIIDEHMGCAGFDNKEKVVCKDCHSNTVINEFKLAKT